jgi:hypothetical protein
VKMSGFGAAQVAEAAAGTVLGWAGEPGKASGCRLSLQNLSGQRLQLEMAPGAAAEVVLQLCRSGWGAL